MTSSNGLEDNADVTVIQTLALLALIDATGTSDGCNGSKETMLRGHSGSPTRCLGEGWDGCEDWPGYADDA